MKNITKLVFCIFVLSFIVIGCLDNESQKNEAQNSIKNESSNDNNETVAILEQEIKNNDIKNEKLDSTQPDAGDSESGFSDINQSSEIDNKTQQEVPNNEEQNSHIQENDINPVSDSQEEEQEEDSIDNNETEHPATNHQKTENQEKVEEEEFEEKEYTNMMITEETLLQDRDEKIKDKKVKETFLDRYMSTYVTDEEDNHTILDDWNIKMKPGWHELGVNIIEQSPYAVSMKPKYEAFSSDEIYQFFYNRLKGLPPSNKVKSGVNFDYNIAVAVTMGEKYLTGYKIEVRKAIFTGESILIYYTELKPDASVERRKTVSNPYCIASIYDDKKIREKAKVISFYNTNTNRLSMSIPVVRTRRYPNFEIPEQVRTIQVEKGDYCNFKEEGYYAFNSHFGFDSIYYDLKENDRYKVRPPELSFLGNIVVVLSLGEKENGGYGIYANGSFTTAYMLGDDMYVMVRKVEPTEDTIRYYDITQPYSIASIQVGIRWKYIRNVYFLDELTGEKLADVNLGKARW